MMRANALKLQHMRKRLPRYKFESTDRTLLQNLVNKYIGILEQKAVNQNMLDEKKRAWLIITQKFNTQSIDKRVRDAKQLRKCWENMKWRARREAKQASMDVDGLNEHDVMDLSDSSMSGLVGVEHFMDGRYDEEDDDEEEELDDDEGEDEDEYDEEEEVVAPMGTEPIPVGDDTGPGPNGNGPLMRPPPDPRPPDGYPLSHPPDDELIGSFVADAWIAEDGPGENDDREAIHIKAEVLELVEPVQEHQLWNGASSSSPARSLGGTSSISNTRTPPPTSETNQDPTRQTPSVSSSAGDAAESVSSRLSMSSTTRSKKRPRERANHNNLPQRASPAASMVLVDCDAAPASSRAAEEGERQLRADEEHAKRMELLQAQLDYEKSKVERMRRMMEMSEIEHRARMRMLVRYQQVAEKQKDYWSNHTENGVMQIPSDHF